MSPGLESEPDVIGPRQYRNSEKLITSADPVWQAAVDNGLAEMVVRDGEDGCLVVAETGHEFINMCSCSYLGLNRHPAIIRGAMQALRDVGTTGLGLATTRMRYDLHARLEGELAGTFGATCLLGLSCSVLTSGILPLLAAGQLTDGKPLVMAFDRFSHFSMAYIKPICADETLVLTCPHNDLDVLESICKKYPRVAYVTDGAHSMGGAVAMKSLQDLQDRYGLFLFVDDSHSLSIVGRSGEGYARSCLPMTPLTIIVASLGKAFGSLGGVAMLGSGSLARLLQRHAGPVGWSQNIQVPALGAGLASAAIHRTAELGELQRRLHENVELFDNLIPTPYAGDGLTVRRIDVGDADRAVEISAELFRRGYYCSPVFFPIVPRGEAGLRIMLRADLTSSQISGLAHELHALVPGANR
jgi:7-keto-8-aminopelargonate synthetase-like enzyme